VHDSITNQLLDSTYLWCCTE